MIAICAVEAANEVRGTNVYARDLIHALAEVDTDHHYTVFTNNVNAYRKILKNPNFRIHPVNIDPQSISSVNSKANLGLSPEVIWMHTEMFALTNQYQAKLIHPLGYVGPQYRRKDCCARIIITAHGLEHEVVPQFFREDMVRFLQKCVPAACQNADHIIAVSHYVKNNLQNYYQLDEGKITVVHHGVSDLFRRPINKRSIKEPYLLYVGSDEERKNFRTVLKGFHIYKRDTTNSDLKLVVAGGNFNAFMGEIHLMNLSDDIIFLGVIPRKRLPALYQHALAFVTLSFYEGFGLVAAEALTSSVPLIASNIPAFAEIINTAGVLVDPNDSDAFADAISRITKDKTLYGKLRNQARSKRNQYTTQKMALETKQVYTMMLNQDVQ